ncbi:MAG: Type II secretion system protein [Candidatus Azambacteria bacterium GW2011_GWA2_39_10]|uniref:Type II secretion system protein n=1 Tax=Candidatus Azambacteria bacterium GW2011_GWA2_39_10 TaxID=1618611 RepID=A0A0G0P3W8_9BACT|nr:MAG: Type II secretion system protein [Candidatus Azambacteria bacterium GW2011_GWA2_39_10]
MAKFQYTARTKEGKLESDIAEASSLEAAISMLQNQQLVIIEIKPFIEAEYLNLNILTKQIASLINRIKSEDIVLFSKQLSILIQAKVPLVQSLRVLTKQTRNPNFAGIINAVANDVDAGMIFSRALSKYPKVFSNFFIQMTRSGEISGRLEETLTYLSDYINKQYLLNSKARGAMIYPAFIVGAFIIVGVLMLIFVVPNLTSILTESGQELPFVTRLLIGTANFTKNWGWIVFIILGAMVYFVRISLKKSPEWQYAYDGLKLRFPIFGELLKKIYLARFSETLSTLSSAGIAISQSLEITADVVGNSVYKRIILEADEAVRKGSNISVVFARYPEILPMVTQMISIGEQTGKLDSILKQISAFFTEEVNRAFDNIVNLIEPILIVVLGAGVGILVAAILLPIYNLVNAF